MVRGKKNKLGIFIAALLVAASCTPLFLHAETAAELQAKIDAQNKALSSLEAEIAGYQQQLSVIGSNKNTLTNAIKKLTLESQALKTSIAASQNKIDTADYKIEVLSDSIGKTAATIDDLKDAIAKNLREMNSQDNDTVGNILLSGHDFSTLWHYLEEQSLFRKGLNAKTQQLSTTKQALEENKQQVESVKKDLLVLDSQLQDQKKLNQQTAAQKAALLASTKNQESAYQKLVAKKIAAKNQMTADLHDFESQLKYVLNPGSLPAPGSAPLAWPLKKVTITQLFGKTVSAARLYTSGSHNGVDFGANTGTAVMAMAAGTVAGTGNADISCPGASYGKWVFIKYDNGLASVYGHLSLVKTVLGARVNSGDVVALVGATGYATGPHLHVSIFANDGVSINSFKSQSCVGKTITIPTAAANAYLDPMLYWPKNKP